MSFAAFQPSTSDVLFITVVQGPLKTIIVYNYEFGPRWSQEVPPSVSVPDVLNDLCDGGFRPSPVPQDRRSSPGRRSNAASANFSALSGQGAQQIFAADVNGDGIPDSIDLSSGRVVVSLVNPAGNITASHTYSAGTNPFFGLAADFNGDGKIDIAISNNGMSQGNGSGVSILLGNGDGTFQTAKNTAINGSPWAIAAADFNGNGRTDLAVTDENLSVVWVLAGNGDGTFQAPVSYSSGNPAVYDNILNSMVVADFNNDGVMDLAVLGEDPQSISVLLGKGDGTFRAALVSPGGPAGRGDFGYLAYADLNHDGNLDLAAVYKNANMIAVLLGKGDGTFQPARSYVTGSNPTTMGVVPLGDGNTALITLDAITGNGIVQFAHSDGTLGAPGLYPLGTNHGFSGGLSSIAAADMNGDQIPDVITYEPATGTVDVLIANGNGTLQPPVAYVLSDASSNSLQVPQSVAVGDLNGDGKPDVVVLASDGINVLLGNGNGSLAAARTTVFGTRPSGVVLADFNGDGKLDAAVADLGVRGSGGALWILLGNGDGTFQTPVSSAAGAFNSLVAADLNGDGKPDLAAVVSTRFDTGAGSVVVLLNNGNGTFRPGTTIRPSATAQTIAVAAGDVNGDGKTDLAIAIQDQTAGDGAAVYLGNGDGTFLPAPYTLAGETNPQDVRITDLNVDGKADLILSFCCGVADAEYFLSRGDGTFSSPGHVPSGPSPIAAAVTDFNGDGLPDLAFADSYGYIVPLNSFFPVVSGACAYYVSPAVFQAAAGGGTFSITISTDPSCAWNSIALPPWITTSGAISGAGSGTVNIQVAANGGSARSATINVAGRLITITQGTAGCGFALSAGAEGFPAAGGSGTIAVTANPGCAWTVNGAPAWVTLTNGTGNGTGNANFTVPVNPGIARNAVLTIGGISFTVEQAAGSIAGLAPVGSVAQVASQGTWEFTLDAVNLGAANATARFNFSDNNGNPLTLPLTFPQLAPAAGPELASTLDRTLQPNGQIVMESTGPDNVAPLVGAGQLLSDGNVSGFGVFSNPKVHWNAVVPLETRNASKYILAFDNTAPLTTGVAIANLTGNAASVPALIRDDTGTQIGNPTIPLNPLGHTSFMLNDPQLGFPVTNGRRGTIEFDTPPGGQLSVLGLRANGPALTTLPVLPDVGASGGSITHVAYSGGWTSAFYIVNTGNFPAQFTLSFFDENGIALPVPLLLPQTAEAVTSSSLTKTLSAGQMLVIDTSQEDLPATVIGSARLTTTGNISGFEIFRWNTFNQEASVPLETRTPNSFVLLFDDTNGLTTGVALAASGSPANITATFRDDTGAQMGMPQTISLPANGHKSFLLPELLQAVVGKRGMVEFAAPQGAGISVIGLRAKSSDGTLTTIPVLAK